MKNNSARRGWVSALTLLLLCFVEFSHAAEVPGFDKEVLIKTREQPVNRFITELFGRINVPVVVAPEITGVVNGDFIGSAESVFDMVAKTFFITLYYDGSMAYVYPANQSERKMLKLSKSLAARVVSNAEQMSLQNVHNTLLKTDMGVVVSGSKQFHEQVNEIIAMERKNLVRAKPVAPSEPERVPEGDVFRIFKLRYAWAHDVTMNVGGSEVTVPGVASTLRTLIDPALGGSVVDDADIDRSESASTVEKLKGTGLQTSGNESAAAGVVLGADPKQGSRIVADSVNNAVLIRDTPSRLEMYAQLISTLDVEPKMVEIEATIIDMNTDRLRELGVNWRAQTSEGEALVGSGTGSDLSLQSDSSQITPLGQGGILSFVLGDRDLFISRIRALETQGAARIVSKPHVMTLSNVEALLDTTSTFFVRVEGQEEVDLFNVSVGTTLRVTPHVFDGPRGPQIKLLVSIEDGSASDRVVDNIPVIDTSSINTQALVNVGESLLIGGLVREINSNGVSKVPLLGDIPGLGAMFRTNRKSSRRVERLFLITPRLNLRSDGVDPKRLNVPYLSGTEGELLVSAPARLTEAREALAARDDNYEIRQELPSGAAKVQLTPRGTPSVVRRLDLKSPPTSREPALLPPSGVGVDKQEKQWQVVGTAIPVAAVVPVLKPIPTPFTEEPDDFDEWQEITQ